MGKSMMAFLPGMPTLGFGMLFVMCFVKQFVMYDKKASTSWYGNAVSKGMSTKYTISLK